MPIWVVKGKVDWWYEVDAETKEEAQAIYDAGDKSRVLTVWASGQQLEWIEPKEEEQELAS